MSSARELMHAAGVELGHKMCLRMTYEVSETALRARKAAIRERSAGQDRGEFAGRRVVAAVDGGRINIRRRVAGRPRKGGRKHFETEWREPKVLTIYVLNAEGKRDRGDLLVAHFELGARRSASRHDGAALVFLRAVDLGGEALRGDERQGRKLGPPTARALRRGEISELDEVALWTGEVGPLVVDDLLHVWVEGRVERGRGEALLVDGELTPRRVLAQGDQQVTLRLVLVLPLPSHGALRPGPGNPERNQVGREGVPGEDGPIDECLEQALVQLALEALQLQVREVVARLATSWCASSEPGPTAPRASC